MLSDEIGTLLRGSGSTLAVAESCTGGRISSLLTMVSGASQYYLGGITSYSAEVKKSLLGVPSSSIDDCGIVSSEVASKMAIGVRTVLGSTYSLSTTGWADRYGDEREPSGTVWIGIDGPLGTRTARFRFTSDRQRNIEQFADAALDELRKYIVEDQMRLPHSSLK